MKRRDVLVGMTAVAASPLLPLPTLASPTPAKYYVGWKTTAYDFRIAFNNPPVQIPLASHIAKLAETVTSYLSRYRNEKDLYVSVDAITAVMFVKSETSYEFFDTSDGVPMISFFLPGDDKPIVARISINA